MEQLAQSVEKLLWFIYRTVFTLFPTILFLLVTWLVYLIKVRKIVNVEGLEKVFHETGQSLSPLHGFLIISLGFTISFIMDAVAGKIFQFDRLINANVEDYGIFKKFNDHIQNDFKSRLSTTESISPRELAFISRLNLSQKNISLYNYYWFVFCNHKIAINTALYILIAICLYVPLFSKSTNLFYTYFGNFSISILFILSAYNLVLAENSKVHFLNKVISYPYLKLTFGMLFMLSGLLFFFLNNIQLSFFLLFFPVFYILIQNGYENREYSRKIPLVGYISQKIDQANLLK